MRFTGLRLFLEGGNRCVLSCVIQHGAGGLSKNAGEPLAVNAIGTQLRDPINLGLTRWRMAVLNK